METKAERDRHPRSHGGSILGSGGYEWRKVGRDKLPGSARRTFRFLAGTNDEKWAVKNCLDLHVELFEFRLLTCQKLAVKNCLDLHIRLPDSWHARMPRVTR